MPSFLASLPSWPFILPIVLIAAVFPLTSAVKILREYERAVVFTLGRFQAVKGRGWYC